jgi:hypothetical protein
MSDIPSFVRTLLSGAPKAPHAVQLEMDVDGDAVALYEVLLQIFITILKHWYTPPIDLGKVSTDHMYEMKRYFESFGVKLHVREEETPHVLAINNRDYENKRDLKDMQFQMTSGSTLYTVWFQLF